MQSSTSLFACVALICIAVGWIAWCLSKNRSLAKEMALLQRIGNLTKQISQRESDFSHQIENLTQQNHQLQSERAAIEEALSQRFSNLNESAAQDFETCVNTIIEINLRKLNELQKVLSQCSANEQFARTVGEDARVLTRKDAWLGFSGELTAVQRELDALIRKRRDGAAALENLLVVLKSRAIDDAIGDTLLERIRKTLQKIRDKKVIEKVEAYEMRSRDKEAKKNQEYRDAYYEAERRERERTITNPKLGKMAIDP